MQLPRLKEWREFRGLTQPELAERAGLSLRTVFNYEHGGNALPNNARKLAAALGVDIGDLISEEARPKGSAPPSQRSFNHLLAEERRGQELEEIRALYRPVKEGLDRHAARWEERLRRSPDKGKTAKEFFAEAEDLFPVFVEALVSEVLELSRSLETSDTDELYRASTIKPVLDRYISLADILRREREGAGNVDNVIDLNDALRRRMSRKAS